jgi:hypothetical protein
MVWCSCHKSSTLGCGKLVSAVFVKRLYFFECFGQVLSFLLGVWEIQG